MWLIAVRQVEMEKLPSVAAANAASPTNADIDLVNSQQKLASLAGVVITTDDVISMETMEAARHGAVRSHREHG